MYHIQWLFMIFDISTYDYLRGLWHFAQVYELSMKMEILQKTCDCPIVFPIPQIPEKHSYRGGNEVQNKCFLLPLDNSISSTIIFASNFLLIHLLDLNFGQCQSLKLFLPEEVIIFAQYTVSSLVYKQKFMVCIVGKFYVCQWLMHSNFVYIYIPKCPSSVEVFSFCCITSHPFVCFISKHLIFSLLQHRTKMTTHPHGKRCMIYQESKIQNMFEAILSKKYVLNCPTIKHQIRITILQRTCLNVRIK